MPLCVGLFSGMKKLACFCSAVGSTFKILSLGTKLPNTGTRNRLCQVEDAMEDNSKTLSHSRLVDVELLETRVDPLSSLENGVSLQEAIELLALNTRMYRY